MEEREQEQQQPDEKWNGEERRHAGNGEYKGDERRKAMEQMPGGDPQGGQPGMG